MPSLRESRRLARGSGGRRAGAAASGAGSSKGCVARLKGTGSRLQDPWRVANIHGGGGGSADRAAAQRARNSHRGW